MRPSKFMAGCRGLNANEVKVYISLICRIMEHGSAVEEDHEILATYCEMRPTSFATALDRLVRLKKLIRTDDGHLTNAFCDGEITWRACYSENAKRAGQKSAEKRKGNQAPTATDVEPAFNHKRREEEIREEVGSNEPTARKRALSARDHLEPVIGADLAAAFCAHRTALKAQMTPHAGKLMASKLAAMPDPVAAVTLSLERGWKGVFDPEPAQVHQFPRRGRISDGERLDDLLGDLTARVSQQRLE